MKNKRLLTGGIVFTLLMTVSSISVFATGGDAGIGGNGPEITEEEREKLKEVFEEDDYDAWVEFVTESAGDREFPMLELVTEDNFDKFAEAHLLMIDAHEKMEEAHDIMDELGIDQGFGEGKHQGEKGMRGHHEFGMQEGQGFHGILQEDDVSQQEEVLQF